MATTRHHLRIADLGFELLFEGAPPAGFPDAAHRDFLADGPADVRLRFWTDPLPSLADAPSEPLFETPGLWSAFRVAGRQVVRLALPEPGARPFRLAIFDPDFRRGEIHTDPDADPKVPAAMVANPLAYPLGELMMIGLLARGSGLLMHAAGVDDSGKGLLFVGHSGAGKTTLARLWEREAALLNDDRVVLREQGGRFWIHGTPWHGEHTATRPDGVPLARVFIIEHGAVQRLRLCAPAAATPLLLARSFPPHWDAAGMAFSLDFCSRLAAAVPVWHLEFTPDAQVVETIRCGC